MGTHNRITRRGFIKLGVATAGAAIAGPGMLATAYANRHAHPHPGSLDYLDRNTYLKNMEVVGNFQLGEERGGKMQMMAVGPRRFLSHVMLPFRSEVAGSMVSTGGAATIGGSTGPSCRAGTSS